MIDTNKLREGLNKLTGHDFEFAEAMERAAGNAYPIINFSRSFQARLAASALDMNVHDIKNLPLKEYTALTNEVSNFLSSTSDGETP